MGEPITIGDVRIHTGDFILGDRDGVVVMPTSAASNVANLVHEVMNTENELRNMILEWDGSAGSVYQIPTVLK